MVSACIASSWTLAIKMDDACYAPCSEAILDEKVEGHVSDALICNCNCNCFCNNNQQRLQQQ